MRVFILNFICTFLYTSLCLSQNGIEPKIYSFPLTIQPENHSSKHENEFEFHFPNDILKADDQSWIFSKEDVLIIKIVEVKDRWLKTSEKFAQLDRIRLKNVGEISILHSLPIKLSFNEKTKAYKPITVLVDLFTETDLYKAINGN